MQNFYEQPPKDNLRITLVMKSVTKSGWVSALSKLNVYKGKVGDSRLERAIGSVRLFLKLRI